MGSERASFQRSNAAAGFVEDMFFTAIEASLAGNEAASWLRISEGLLLPQLTYTLIVELNVNGGTLVGVYCSALLLDGVQGTNGLGEEC